jgi:microcin C transport system permease protein
VLAYILRRLLLVIPTLLGIVTINFVVVQFAPGGPVHQAIAELRGTAGSAFGRITGEGAGDLRQAPQGPRSDDQGGGGTYRGARGLDPELIRDLERQFGFDRPVWERFWIMLRSYATFDFGESFFRGRSVVALIIERLPVSVTLGLWSTLIVYLVSIPLGIRKAVKDGSRFDVATSTVVLGAYAIPGFLFATLLLVLFAGGTFVQWFPLGGLASPGAAALPWPERVLDYLWHAALPTLALIIGGFAGLTMLTKNSFIDQIRAQYAVTARAKGASERRVLYGHVFRNAMILIVAGFPAAFIGILFTGSLLIEVIFSLDGLGSLAFEAALRRDYPVMFGTLWIFGLLGLAMNIIGDLMYTVVDPRIDFARR